MAKVLEVQSPYLSYLIYNSKTIYILTGIMGHQGDPKKPDWTFIQFLVMKMHLKENKNVLSKDFTLFCKKSHGK